MTKPPTRTRPCCSAFFGRTRRSASRAAAGWRRRGPAAVAVVVAAALAACGAGGDDVVGRGPGTASALPGPPASGGGQPFLASAGEGAWMSWIEPYGDGRRVAVSFFDGSWSTPATVAESDSFFVNWADFPSVQPVGGALVAHWLERQGTGTYDYGVRMAWSLDGGRSWSEPWTPHGDDTPTEHGFVSVFGAGEEIWAAWLDGRAMVEEGGAMALRARRLPVHGPAGPEEVVDARTCECCQTAGAMTADGPLVAFRNRSGDEVRDVHVSRRTADGWTVGAPVHRDGWVFPGCPVNGPAVAASGRNVVVAWFTAPEGAARVNVAFSNDGGATFGPPFRLDEGAPLGRVDVVALDDGSALAAWMEGGGDAVVLGRRVAAGGAMGPARLLGSISAGRQSGFPRIVRLGEDRLMAAWTDPAGEGAVRTAVFSLADWDPPS